MNVRHRFLSYFSVCMCVCVVFLAIYLSVPAGKGQLEPAVPSWFNIYSPNKYFVALLPFSRRLLVVSMINQGRLVAN